jgi:hypothetical protein
LHHPGPLKVGVTAIRNVAIHIHYLGIRWSKSKKRPIFDSRDMIASHEEIRNITSVSLFEIEHVENVSHGEKQLRQSQTFPNATAGPSGKWSKRRVAYIGVRETLRNKFGRLGEMSRVMVDSEKSCANIITFRNELSIDLDTSFENLAPKGTAGWWTQSQSLVNASSKVDTTIQGCAHPNFVD